MAVKGKRWTVVLLVGGALAVAATGVCWLELAVGGSAGQAAESGGTTPANSSASPAKTAERAVSLEGERITLRSVQRSVGAVGTFAGFDEVTVKAEVSGPVAKVYHDVGDIVHPGDVLIELDKTDFDLELELTRRALELEVVRLGVKVPEEPLSPDQISALLRQFKVESLPSIKRAQEQEQNATSRLQRAEQLRQRNSMSQEEFEQRQMEYDVAKSAFDQASYDAEAALAAIRHRAVQLRIAMRKLELTTIRVPTPTKRQWMPEQVQYAVVERKVTEGDLLKDSPGSSTAAFDLVMDGVLKLEAQVPERYVAEVKGEQDCVLHVDAYPNRVFSGKVVRINPTVDRTNRTFEVEILVSNEKRELKAGGFAKVDILTRVDPAAWTVSPESIVTYAGSTRLFVVRQGKAHSVVVEKGIDGAGWVELLHSADVDLRPDDIVVRGGQDKLAEGISVQIRNAAQLNPAKPAPAGTR